MALIPRRKNKSAAHPSRQQTGTSYTSDGQASLQAADLKETGSSRGTVLIDPVPALTSDYVAAQTYTKMTRSDVSVRIGLRAGKAPVLGADYFIEPFSDQPLDLIIQEFVDFNLFSGMTKPWLQTLELILKFFESPKGNSIFETVFEQREWAPKKFAPGSNRKNYTMLRKLAYRPPSTINAYTWDDNGGPAGVTQNAIRADGTSEEVTLPINKLAIFVFDPDDSGVTGTSILRSAYRNWFYKDRMYAIDGVQKERHGIGVPEGELQPGYDERDKAAAIEMLRNLRTNETGFILRDTKLKVSFAEVPGNLVDALASATHHDTMIMKNIMVQFLNAGVDSSGGGRATSATALDTFLKAMEYIANSICDIINMYVIPSLVGYNFKTDRFPSLKVKGIGQAKDLAMFAAAMNNLAKAGALEFDEATKEWVRASIDAPRIVIASQDGAGAADSPPPVAAPTETPTVPAPTSNGNSKDKVPQGFNMGKSPSSGAE